MGLVGRFPEVRGKGGCLGGRRLAANPAPSREPSE